MDISGHITVCKVYKDGTSEVVVDRENLITAGLGYSFMNLLQGRGSSIQEDYTPRYFQVGTNDIGYAIDDSASSFFYRLSGPFDWADYGDDTDLIVEDRYRCFLASSLDEITYTELLLASAAPSAVIYSGTDEFFGTITPSRITKFVLDSFASEIILDEKTGNGQSISELGLFIKNPRGLAEDSPLLIAYKKFTAIPKTADFSIIIHWNIGFLGISNTGDNVFTGGIQKVKTI